MEMRIGGAIGQGQRDMCVCVCVRQTHRECYAKSRSQMAVYVCDCERWMVLYSDYILLVCGIEMGAAFAHCSSTVWMYSTCCRNFPEWENGRLHDMHLDVRVTCMVP